MSAPHFAEAAEFVARYKREATLLGVMDAILGPQLLQAAVVEIGEVEEELDLHGSDSYDSKKVWGELGDVFSFAAAYAITEDKGVRDGVAWDRIEKANGYGKRSYALDRLAEPLLHIQEKDGANEAAEFMARLYSLCNYLPITPQQIDKIMEQTARKVLANRPPELYQPVDVRTGKTIIEEPQLWALYNYLEKGTRMVRNHVERTMKPQDWWDLRELMRDFHNEQDNLALLSSVLEQSPSGVVTLPDDIVLPDFSLERAEYQRPFAPRQQRTTVFDSRKLAIAA